MCASRFYEGKKKGLKETNKQEILSFILTISEVPYEGEHNRIVRSRLIILTQLQ